MLASQPPSVTSALFSRNSVVALDQMEPAPVTTSRLLFNGPKVPPKVKRNLKAGDKIKVGKVELEVKTVVKKATGVQK